MVPEICASLILLSEKALFFELHAAEDKGTVNFQNIGTCVPIDTL